MVIRLSDLHNRISLTGKTTSVYWIRALLKKWLLHWPSPCHTRWHQENCSSLVQVMPWCWYQAIVSTSAALFSIESFGASCNDIAIIVQTIYCNKRHLKVSSAKCHFVAVPMSEFWLSVVLDVYCPSQDNDYAWNVNDAWPDTPGHTHACPIWSNHKMHPVH